MRDTQNFAKDVIYRAENLLQNGFPLESPFSAPIAKIEFEKLQIQYFAFLHETVLDIEKMDRTIFIRLEIFYSECL